MYVRLHAFVSNTILVEVEGRNTSDLRAGANVCTVHVLITEDKTFVR